MNCKVYRTKTDSRYVIVPSQTKLGDPPQEVQDEIVDDEACAILDLKQPPNDPAEVMKKMDEKGYCITKAQISFE